MKRSLFLIFSGLIITHSFPQTSTQGLYLTASDFNNGKLSYIPEPGEKYKLIVNDAFYKPYLKIYIGDSIYTISKDSVFGYRNAEAIGYRFFEKNTYRILNPTESILLYSTSSRGGYKNSETLVKYYFSVNANSAVEPLTKGKLKDAFTGDTAFIELLDIYFIADNELLNYDDFYKMYKINRVLQVSQQFISKAK